MLSLPPYLLVYNKLEKLSIPPVYKDWHYYNTSCHNCKKAASVIPPVQMKSFFIFPLLHFALLQKNKEQLTQYQIYWHVPVLKCFCLQWLCCLIACWCSLTAFIGIAFQFYLPLRSSPLFQDYLMDCCGLLPLSSYRRNDSRQA